MSKQQDSPKTERLSLRLTKEQVKLLEALMRPLRQPSVNRVVEILIEDEAKRQGIEVKQ